MGQSIVPECIQSDCTADQLNVSLQSMIDIDEQRRANLFRELRRELEVG